MPPISNQRLVAGYATLTSLSNLNAGNWIAKQRIGTGNVKMFP